MKNFTLSLDQGQKYLLGFSGGADSVCLFHLLRTQGYSFSAAHVNHGIRGAEADRDADFCRELAVSYGLEFLELKADVPALAKLHGRSLELEAREVRYAFFQQIMRERGVRVLVTAHHADDNLETVLFRICRGTGLHGLVGIAPSRPFADGVLVRPLLPFSKREILAFCQSEGLNFVTDSTNDRADCSRNQIRLEAIPPLEARFPSVQSNVYRMTRALADDQSFLDQEAESFFKTHLQNGGISVAALRELHPSIRRRVIGKMFPKTMELVHLDAVEGLLEKNSSGTSVSLPGDVCASLQSGRLLALPDLRRAPVYPPFPCVVGETCLCDGRLTVSVKPCEARSNLHHGYQSACVLKKEMQERDLYFRSRQNGDTMLRNGVNRQIRRLYREAGVPTAARDALPLLCAGDTVLWAPFVGYADGVLIESESADDLLIEVWMSCYAEN